MMRKRFYFGTNFKMFPTAAESAAFIRAVRARIPPARDAQVFAIPPFTSLAGLDALKGNIWIGAQTMHDAESGAHTGEISARMLMALNVDLVMLGHAERRAQFGETDAALRRKVRAALDAGLRVLLCVGENAFDYECGVTAETVARQVKIALHAVTDADLQPDARVMVAYEPVWSIGASGTPAQPDDVARAVNAIRAALTVCCGDAAIPLLYGGSVTAANAAGYARMDGIDGLFVGRAAWTVDGFIEVLNIGLHATGIGREF
ncbi:MAG: triose-phosphate isomerase [Chloroflexota bacterium]|nr:triose-phosphate isomerase [Chloroflexota bacterium]